jgi:hypothetical protein
LDSIPLDQRAGVTLIAQSRSGDADPRTVTIVGVDPELTTLTLKEASGTPLALPLDRVASVWRRDERHWSITLSGRFEIANGTLVVLGSP